MQYVTHATITNRYLPRYLEIADIRMEYNIIASYLITRAAICRSIATRRKSNINFQRHAPSQIKCYIHKITCTG